MGSSRGLQRTSADTVERCLEQLHAFPNIVEARLYPASPSEEADRRLQLEFMGGAVHKLPVEIKGSHLRRETALMIIHRARDLANLVVFAPSVGRDLGDLFERERVNFVDAAGNCHLRFEPDVFIRIQGRKPVGARKSTGMRAPAYRVLLSLLTDPEALNLSSRQIADDASVSPQTANNLRRRLEEAGLVLKTRERRHWAPNRGETAREMWLAGFGTALFPSLEIGRFRAQEIQPRDLEERITPILNGECDWRYGGGAAAARLTDYYRGERTIVYLQDPPMDLWRKLRLVRDTKGPVVLAYAPTKTSFRSPHPACVHPLLAYADLLLEHNDRAREAAELLFNRFLSEQGGGR